MDPKARESQSGSGKHGGYIARVVAIGRQDLGVWRPLGMQTWNSGPPPGARQAVPGSDDGHAPFLSMVLLGTIDTGVCIRQAKGDPMRYWVKHQNGKSAVCNWRALSCIGNQLLGVGVLPNSQMLDKAGISVDNTDRVAAETGKRANEETPLGADSVTSVDKKAVEKP